MSTQNVPLPVDQREHAVIAAGMIEEVAKSYGSHDIPGREVIAMAQTFATLAVWAELKRANDQRDQAHD